MIGAIQNGYYNNALVTQIGQQGTTNPAAINADASSSASQVNAAAQGGTFASAISQALAGIGVGASSGTASGSTAAGSASAQSPQQALNAFMQSLFAALQSQSGQAAQPGQMTDGASSAASGISGMTGASGASGHHFHHGGGMEAKLQSLIQQLSSSASSASAGSSGSGSSSTADAALQQSYQGLLSTQGAAGNQTSLSGFLQALAQNLQGAGSTGNAVNMQV